MSEHADTSTLRSFLDRASRRLGALAAVEGAAAGLAVAALVVLSLWSVPLRSSTATIIVALAVSAGVAFRLLITARRRRDTALMVERAAPACHNLVVSASEIMRHPHRVRDAVAALVFRQATTAVRTLNVAKLFPAKRTVLMLSGSALLLALTFTLRSLNAASSASPNGAAGATVPDISRVDVRVEAPVYAERAPQTLRDPARIEALAGSRVTLTVSSNAASVSIETLEGTQPLTAAGTGVFSGTVLANADGFIAVAPTGALGAGTRKLIGLSVKADQPPKVRLTAPGKDMMFPDGNRALDVAIEADDDLALGALRLKYTKVSGSGERFTFTEGDVPVQMTRTSASDWKARVRWNLASLELAAGDMVVYRAVATDRRPGAPSSESDSFIAEILQVGGDAAAGFSIDPEQERYALSQQMIIMKTERLVAKRSTLSAEAFANEANEIAVEQRRVRAEFVFMMGGELEDVPDPDADMTMLNEEEEAESESDILDGRGANIGRLAIVRAVRAMSGAASLLNVTNVPEALRRERTALRELERAFSHTRIILRALTQQERLDLARRMTGPLLEAGRAVYSVPVAEGSVRVTTLRRALADVSSLIGESVNQTTASTIGALNADASARTSALAESVLRVDASARAMQDIAKQLDAAANSYGKNRVQDARNSLEVAAVALTAALRADLLTAPETADSFGTDRLRGALSDAMRSAKR